VPASQLKALARNSLGLAAGLVLSCVVCAQAAQSSFSAPGAQLPPVNATPSAAKGKWNELTLAQQQALEPLAPHWATLSEGQRNKWLAISRNFSTLPEYEKSTMHSRMAEWATLTPQQRIQARLNFGETNRLPQVEKKAQWQAYQSLSEDEKRKLGAAQQSTTMGAAPAPKPAAQDKLLHVQTPNGQLPAKGKAPGVKDLDQKTLLPPTKAAPAKADATPA